MFNVLFLLFLFYNEHGKKRFFRADNENVSLKIVLLIFFDL